MDLIFYCSMTVSAAGDGNARGWFRTVTIYKNNIWSVGLYEAYEDNGGSRTGALPRYHTDYPRCEKDAVFRKGHIITKEDIPVLLSVGKTPYIYGK